jgi:hypothetical protein
MFFLIRCTFWLSIVYYEMPWPPQTAQAIGLQDQVVKAATGVAADLASAAVTMAAAKLEERCVKAPADCLASGARLPQIVAMEPARKGQVLEVLPPKRPLRLAEDEANGPASTRKVSAQHN